MKGHDLRPNMHMSLVDVERSVGNAYIVIAGEENKRRRRLSLQVGQVDMLLKGP